DDAEHGQGEEHPSPVDASADGDVDGQTERQHLAVAPERPSGTGPADRPAGGTDLQADEVPGRTQAEGEGRGGEVGDREAVEPRQAAATLTAGPLEEVVDDHEG